MTDSAQEPATPTLFEKLRDHSEKIAPRRRVEHDLFEDAEVYATRMTSEEMLEIADAKSEKTKRKAVKGLAKIIFRKLVLEDGTRALKQKGMRDDAVIDYLARKLDSTVFYELFGLVTDGEEEEMISELEKKPEQEEEAS